jgi:hypothetical protein
VEDTGRTCRVAGWKIVLCGQRRWHNRDGLSWMVLISVKGEWSQSPPS